jgi:hypothetical protein
MKRHYLGDQFVARLRASNDNVLDNAFYDGKSRTFTFERYCESLRITFTDIEGTGEAVSDSRKLRVFLQGITDTRLTSAKSLHQLYRHMTRRWILLRNSWTSDILLALVVVEGPIQEMYPHSTAPIVAEEVAEMAEEDNVMTEDTVHIEVEVVVGSEME